MDVVEVVVVDVEALLEADADVVLELVDDALAEELVEEEEPEEIDEVVEVVEVDAEDVEEVVEEVEDEEEEVEVEEEVEEVEVVVVVEPPETVKVCCPELAEWPASPE